MPPTKRQSQIVAAALELTAQGGMGRLTIKNLAARLGVSEPAIYRHFSGKSEIVKAMIADFEPGAATEPGTDADRGIAGIESFVRARLELVAARPELAKVMFAEELFMDDPEHAALLLAMMHRHRERLERRFREAQAAGEIRAELTPEILFRLVFGPVRLLVKQWGMSNYAFDLRVHGEELWDALRKILK